MTVREIYDKYAYVYAGVEVGVFPLAWTVSFHSWGSEGARYFEATLGPFAITVRLYQ